jgi:TRAP-type uncharacterized transport system substrate-binding protein
MRLPRPSYGCAALAQVSFSDMLSRSMVGIQPTNRNATIRIMRRTLFFILVLSAAVLLIAYTAYVIIDPLPPRHLAIAAGPVGSEYDTFAKQYARILARHGVMLEVHNSAGAVENLELLRDPASGVQAALTTFGFIPSDTGTLYSLGGIFNSAIYVFYRNDRPVTLFGQFRGKRLAIGMPGTALRSLFLEVLGATDAIDPSTQFLPMDFPAAIDALIAGQIDVAVVPRAAAAARRCRPSNPGTVFERASACTGPVMARSGG